MSNVLPWRNIGQTTAFPFREDAELKSTDGRLIPDEFLVDAQIFVPGHLTGEPFLKTLRISGSRLIGTVAIDSAILGTFTAEAASLSNGYAHLFADSGAMCGTLVFGAGASAIFRTMRVGENIFAANSTRFEPSCVFALPEEVVTELTVDGPVIGKVALAEGDGVRLVKLADNELRFDAVGSATEIEECCENSGNFIKMINDAVPNIYGTILFNLEPFSEPAGPEDQRQVLRFKPLANGLEFFLSLE